ncbi:MAG: hypothetical protein ACLFO1_07570 [Spirochaetaceae bacterium]
MIRQPAMALNSLEGYLFDDCEVDSPEVVHLRAEAFKPAHAAKFRHVAVFRAHVQQAVSRPRPPRRSER